MTETTLDNSGFTVKAKEGFEPFTPEQYSKWLEENESNGSSVVGDLEKARAEAIAGDFNETRASRTKILALKALEIMDENFTNYPNQVISIIDAKVSAGGLKDKDRADLAALRSYMIEQSEADGSSAMNAVNNIKIEAKTYRDQAHQDEDRAGKLYDQIQSTIQDIKKI